MMMMMINDGLLTWLFHTAVQWLTWVGVNL